MPGYANRTKMLSFPELTEEGDTPVHVIIRNPRLIPVQDLKPPDVPTGEDGSVDEQAAFNATFTIMSRLVQAWHVYDATDLSEDQAPLDLPATPELVAKLPYEIQQAITREIEAVQNPGA